MGGTECQKKVCKESDNEKPCGKACKTTKGVKAQVIGEDSAVKTVAAWRQCREESYRKVRKVIEYVHIPSSFLLITFPTFPQKVLFSFVPQFFPFTFLTFPNNFPHFSSFFLRTGLTVLLTFHHFLYYFPHVSS